MHDKKWRWDFVCVNIEYVCCGKRSRRHGMRVYTVSSRRNVRAVFEGIFKFSNKLYIILITISSSIKKFFAVNLSSEKLNKERHYKIFLDGYFEMRGLFTYD